MSTNNEQRLQQRVDELMIRLAASKEARKKAEKENELYRAEMFDAKKSGWYSASELFSGYKALQQKYVIAMQRAEAAEQRIRESQEQVVALLKFIAGCTSGRAECIACGERYGSHAKNCELVSILANK